MRRYRVSLSVQCPLRRLSSTAAPPPQSNPRGVRVPTSARGTGRPALTAPCPAGRFKDVLPYEDNRVRLTPTADNPHGYINASHISVSPGRGLGRKRSWGAEWSGDAVVC